MYPTPSQVKGQLAAAIRWKREDDIDRLRGELRTANAEAEIRRALDGHELTREQYRRLVDVLLEHRPRAELEAEVLEQARDAQRLTDLLAEALRGGAEPADALRAAVRVQALEDAATA